MIRQFIHRIARWIEEVRLTIIVIWRTLNGRWYVYRDMPDWLVFDHAAMTPFDDDELERMRTMAMAEQKLRLDRLMRAIKADIDGLVAEIVEGMKR